MRSSPAAAAAKSIQSCPTLYNPIDGSPPGSPVPGILQARTLEWVAIWIPPKKDTPAPRAKEKLQQDGRRGTIVFKIKPHTYQRDSKVQTKPRAQTKPRERSNDSPTRD